MPSMYMHEEYRNIAHNVWHWHEASKARGEDRCCVREAEHVLEGRRDRNEGNDTFTYGLPHQKEAAAQYKQQTQLGQLECTMSHNNNRQVRCWRGAALQCLSTEQSVTFNTVSFRLNQSAQYCWYGVCTGSHSLSPTKQKPVKFELPLPS